MNTELAFVVCMQDSIHAEEQNKCEKNPIRPFRLSSTFLLLLFFIASLIKSGDKKSKVH